jgi:glycosyltransferase involved in cell wall biosynthesis
MNEPRISIVIPTYKENSYIDRTLAELFKQTLIGEAEVIIADFNPDGSHWYKNYSIRYVPVDRKGIAYARHQGIKAAKGDVIINFDADARFDSKEGLRYMAEPIINGECVLACCDNIFDLTDLTNTELTKMQMPIAAANVLNSVQRFGHVACLEPGSAMSKSAYNWVGGFADVMQHELWNLSHRILLKYLPFNIKHIGTTSVYMSARRAKKFVDLGIGVLDYSNKAFR